MLGNPYRVARKRHPAKRITTESGAEMNSTRGEKNGGFTLVEMIVVLAIMSVLVGVLAPAYLHFVEKSRQRRDDAAAEEIRRAAEIVVLSGTYSVASGTVLVTFETNNGVSVQNDPTGTALNKHLEELFGDLSKVKPTSKTYRNKTYTITIIMPASAEQTPTVIGAWS